MCPARSFLYSAFVLYVVVPLRIGKTSSGGLMVASMTIQLSKAPASCTGELSLVKSTGAASSSAKSSPRPSLSRRSMPPWGVLTGTRPVSSPLRCDVLLPISATVIPCTANPSATACHHGRGNVLLFQLLPACKATSFRGSAFSLSARPARSPSVTPSCISLSASGICLLSIASA